MKDVPGVVYLIHFEHPFKHAQHYIGWTGHGSLKQRLKDHATGRGARLIAAVNAAGIRWTVARLWFGTRAKEKQLKGRGGASRSCPCCGVKISKEKRKLIDAIVTQEFNSPNPMEYITCKL